MPRSRRDDDDDDDDDDRPRRKTRRDRDDEDEDEDDRPRRKRSRSIADDDDDDDDRPRKRKAVNRSKKKAGGSGPLLLILGLAGGLFLLAGGGFALWFFVFNDTPERAFEDLKDASLKKDYGRIYDRMDKETQQDMEKRAELAVQLDRSLAAHSGKKGKELFVAVSKEMDSRTSGSRASFNNKLREDIQNATVEKVEVNGDTATITIKLVNGRTDTGKMVKQDGRWRVKR